MKLTIIQLPSDANEINVDGTRYRPDADGRIKVENGGHAVIMTSPPLNFVVVGHIDEEGEGPSSYTAIDDFKAEDFPAIADLLAEHHAPVPETLFAVFAVLEAILGLRLGKPPELQSDPSLEELADSVAAAHKAHEAEQDDMRSELDKVRAELTMLNIAFPPKASLKVLRSILDAENASRAAQEAADISAQQEATV